MNGNVLILDDDIDSRSALQRSIITSGMNTVAPAGPFRTMESLIEFAKNEGVTHLATDHRLKERTFSSFLGANAAAALNVMKIAPILVTAFASQDMDRDIRQHLSLIPRIVHRGLAGPRDIRDALEASAEEVIKGVIPNSRKKYRSVIKVVDILQRNSFGPLELRLQIRQWRKNVTVGFPASALAQHIQSKLTAGLMMIAQVNIEAEEANELFLMDFELPEIEELDDI